MSTKVYEIPLIILRDLASGNSSTAPLLPHYTLLSILSRIHWNPSNRLLKIVMPSKLHECGSSWLIDSIGEARVQGLIHPVWHHTMDVMPSPGTFSIILPLNYPCFTP